MHPILDIVNWVTEYQNQNQTCAEKYETSSVELLPHRKRLTVCRATINTKISVEKENYFKIELIEG